MTRRRKCTLLFLLLSQFVNRTQYILQQVLLWYLEFIFALIQVFSIIRTADVLLLLICVRERKWIILWQPFLWGWPAELATFIRHGCGVAMSSHSSHLVIDFTLFPWMRASAVIFLQDLLVLRLCPNIESLTDFAGQVPAIPLLALMSSNFVVLHYVARQLHGFQHLQAWVLLSIWVKVFIFLIQIWQLRKRRLGSWLTWLTHLDLRNFVLRPFYVASSFILVNQINNWFIARRHKSWHFISERKGSLFARRFGLSSSSSARRFDSISLWVWCDWILPSLAGFIMFWILMWCQRFTWCYADPLSNDWILSLHIFWMVLLYRGNISTGGFAPLVSRGVSTGVAEASSSISPVLAALGSIDVQSLLVDSRHKLRRAWLTKRQVLLDGSGGYSLPFQSCDAIMQGSGSTSCSLLLFLQPGLGPELARS